MTHLSPIVGTANIVDASDFVTPAGPPHTYLGVARNLLNGAQSLAVAGPNSSIVLAFVAAQVAECALKAFLSRSGDDKRLKDKVLRHNLESLWQAAHAEGLPLTAQPPAWLRTLSHLHNTPYYIRYSTGVHGLVTPPPQPMTTELTAVVGLVAQHL